MRPLFRIVLVVILGVSAGCKKSAETLAVDQIKAMDGVTAILEEIKDDSSAESAIPRLEKAVDRMVDASRAAARSQNIRSGSQAEAEHILKNVAPKMFEAAGRLTGAAMKAQVAAPRHAAKIAEIIKRTDVSSGH